MRQTCNQKRFTISEVAADWRELMITQHTMRHCGHLLPLSAKSWTHGWPMVYSYRTYYCRTQPHYVSPL